LSCAVSGRATATPPCCGASTFACRPRRSSPSSAPAARARPPCCGRRRASWVAGAASSSSIYPALTFPENLVLQSPRGQESEAIDRATSVFLILGQRLSHTAGTMSGGQQQMLALSRAYVRRPKIVLLDEVSMGGRPPQPAGRAQGEDRPARCHACLAGTGYFPDIDHIAEGNEEVGATAEQPQRSF
jgi:hypothetical protein